MRKDTAQTVAARLHRIAKSHRVSMADLCGGETTKRICRVRHKAVASAVSAGFSETEVARALNREQTSIRNSLRRYEEATCKA